MVIIPAQIPKVETNETFVEYTSDTARGPLALTITAAISLIAVIVVFIAILITGRRTKQEFIRSQVGPFFLALIFSDFLQAVGSFMNIKWVITQRVQSGHFCSTQAALKQTGNIGTALWSLVIAFHTFSLLFLRRPIGRSLSGIILVLGWIFVGFIVMMGPVILENLARGPFWGISGYWCWITNDYHVEQFTNEYLYMFITVGVSFILYTLIFLRLRGNIRGYGWDLRFVWTRNPWMDDDITDEEISSLGKQMLWYPIAYAIIVIPIAICRWSVIFGHTVPFWATILADSIFMLSGFVNAILYTTTRKIISLRTPAVLTRLVRESMAGKGFSSSKASLPEMNFAPPQPNPYWEEFQRRHSTAPREPRRATEMARPEFVNTAALQSHNCHNFSVIAPSLNINNITTPHKIIPTDPSASSTSEYRTSMHPFANPHAYCNRLRDPDHNPLQLPSTPPSPSPALTASTPSPSVSPCSSPPRRKRFSGWSLPSLRDGALSLGRPEITLDIPDSHDGGGDAGSSVTDMTDIRFAPPSPQHEVADPKMVRKVSSVFWV